MFTKQDQELLSEAYTQINRSKFLRENRSTISEILHRLDRARNWQHDSSIWDEPDHELTGPDYNSIIDWIEAPAYEEEESEMDMGSEAELEHTDNQAAATQIARDHLREDPKYYTKLKKVGL